MAAIQRTRMSSFGIGVFVVAVSAALLAGGTGGYAVRALTSHVAAPSQSDQYVRVTGVNQDLTESDLTRAQPADRSTGTNQDLTQSDLTRAQPADRSTGTATLPTWVKNYLAPAASQPFKVDQFLESLSSTGTATLPTWVNNYLAPAASQPFKVDQFLESLSYAAQSGASGEAAAPALQFQP